MKKYKSPKIINYYRLRRYKRYKRRLFLSIYNIKNLISYKILIIMLLSIILLYIILKLKILNKIHIAINMDNRYIYSCIVFLTSLLDNRAKSTYYVIHILTNGKLSIDSKNKIINTTETFGKKNSEVIFYDLGDDFKGATISFFATSVYYRISLPSVLSKIDKVIYSDIDVVNFKDLTEMYNIKFEKDKYICGVLEGINLKKDVENLGIQTDKYINAGILLMDLKTMREKSIEKKLRDFIATHVLKYCDQTAINAVCSNNIQVISYKYNAYVLNSYNDLVKINNGQNLIYRYKEYEIYQAYHEPTFFHFCGPCKPWRRSCGNFNKAYWWYYAKKSGFYKEILNHYKNDINYVEKLLNEIPNNGGLIKRKYAKFK